METEPLTCPACATPFADQQPFCDGCGRMLVVDCPQCGGVSAAVERCSRCHSSLNRPCPGCGANVFFDLDRCPSCHHAIRRAKGLLAYLDRMRRR